MTRFSVIVLLVMVAGTAGFMIIEEWSLVEALYMTVITVSTVGFSAVRQLSDTGYVFTIVLIIAGVSSAAYLAGTLGEYVVSGQLRLQLRRRKMERSIEALDKHYIVCGYGRVGEQITDDLSRSNAQFAVVDVDPKRVERAPSDLLYVVGDASDDKVLHEAGIERAEGLVAATGDDARNIFITLTARTLNNDLEIIGRANSPATESKLKRAGANHVISPSRIAGRRISTQLLNPSITNFFDTVMPSGSENIWIEEIVVSSRSDLVGTTIEQSKVKSNTGAYVIAVRRADNETMIPNPPATLEFAVGDILMAFGTRDQLGVLADLAAAGRKPHRQHTVW
ncbi:MAG: potassium channel protein [Gemmatimonadales bacterium]